MICTYGDSLLVFMVSKIGCLDLKGIPLTTNPSPLLRVINLIAEYNNVIPQNCRFVTLLVTVIQVEILT